MDEELILRVIKQVLADPRLQSLIQEQPVTAVRPQMLVLLNYAPDLPGVLREVQGRWGDTHALKVLATDTVVAHKPVLPAGLTWVTCQEAYEGCWQRMVMPTCSANTLAKIALGLTDAPVPAMAAEGIMRGIPVELHTGHIGLTTATPAAYRQLYQDYLARVESYGVVLRGNEQGSGQIMAAPGGAPVACRAGQASGQTGETEQTANTVDWPNRLLTEKDVLTFPAGCAVRVSRSAIISPLARDMLAQRRVTLVREGEPRP
jgi:hypothetical protein